MPSGVLWRMLRSGRAEDVAGVEGNEINDGSLIQVMSSRVGSPRLRKARNHRRAIPAAHILNVEDRVIYLRDEGLGIRPRWGMTD